MQRGHMTVPYAAAKWIMQIVDMKMNQVKLVFVAENVLQQHYVMRQMIDRLRREA